tara:strand:+ start:1094 stop:1366 length:273 start_codon:yes stop_codon:yes gene_type:complete
MSSSANESNNRLNIPSLGRIGRIVNIRNIGRVCAGVVITGLLVSTLKYTWNYYSAPNTSKRISDINAKKNNETSENNKTDDDDINGVDEI